MKNLIVTVCSVISVLLLTTNQVNAQKVTFIKYKMLNNTSNKRLFDAKYAGAIPKLIKVKQLAPVNSDRKTVRGNLTRIVVPYDGSNIGSSETEGSETQNKNGNASCSVQPVTISAGYNELALLDPNAVEIWPGRIIRISSIDDGSYTSFTDYTSRKDLKVALVAAGTSQRSIIETVPATTAITQGRVIDARDRLKNQFGSNDFGSDSWMYESYNYYEMNQLFIEAGAGVSVPPANFDLRASASFNSSVKKNKIIIKFARKAFDVKVDNDLSDLVIAPNLSNDAGIIYSVGYGSLGIVEIESDSSLTDMSAALDFAFNVDPSVAISGNMRTQLNNTLQSMTVKAIFKGVAGNGQIQTFPSINDVKNLLIGTTPLSATTPVVPLSFSIKSLKDGSTMMLKSTLSYNKRECTMLPPGQTTTLKIKFLALTVPNVNDGLTGEEDIYGKIKVRANLPNKDEYINIWNRSRDEYVAVGESQLPTDNNAYNLSGDASIFAISFKNDEVNLDTKKLYVRLDLKDYEPFGRVVDYSNRTYEFSLADLIKSSTATPNDVIDNFNNAARAFVTEVVEQGQTNKVKIWFKVEKTVTSN